MSFIIYWLSTLQGPSYLMKFKHRKAAWRLDNLCVRRKFSADLYLFFYLFVCLFAFLCSQTGLLVIHWPMISISLSRFQSEIYWRSFKNTFKPAGLWLVPCYFSFFQFLIYYYLGAFLNFVYLSFYLISRFLIWSSNSIKPLESMCSAASIELEILFHLTRESNCIYIEL